MKSKLLLPGALSALLCITGQAQIPITTNTLPPAVGAYDQYYLPGPVDEASGTMTSSGADLVNAWDNDTLTYVAADRPSKGQSFTTGPNPAGYTIRSVTFRHTIWSNYLNNGTWMNIPSPASFALRFGTITGANITSILDTNGTYSGAALNMGGGTGTGIYFTCDLTGAGLGVLLPNTTYFFEVAPGSGQYLELHNTRTNATSYTGGTAFYGDINGQLDQSGVVNLPPYGGQFAFVAKLSPVGAPSVTAVASPAATQGGQKVTVTATVTPGIGTVTNVNVNLSSIGGASSLNLVLSATANVYTNTFTVPAAAPLGAASLPVTVTDTTPLSGTYGVDFTVLPSAVVWTGGSLVDSRWTSTNNWQGGFAPALTGNDVVFAGATRLSPDMDLSYSVTKLVFSNTASSFSIGSSAGGTLTVGSGGIVDNSASAQTLNVPVVLGAAQTINVASGLLTLNSNVTGGLDITTAGAGAVTFASPGTNTLGNLRVGSGQLNITAGTVNVSNTQGSLTRVESNAVVTVSGGTLNILGGAALNGWFPIGVTAGATGTVVVAGGTINVNDHWGTEVGNEAGAGVLTINSGTFLNNDAGNIGLLIGEGGSMGGIVHLNGGELVVNKIVANAGGSFFFNGGTLKPLASRTDFFNDAATLTVEVRNGGAVVDTTGFDVTIGEPLNHSTLPGDNATDGGLAKLGNGRLVLTSGYQYNGPTRVLGGSLTMNLSLGVPVTAGDLVVSNAALVLDASSGVAMPAANVTLNSAAIVTLTNNASMNAINGTGNLLVETNTALSLNYGAVGGFNPSAPAITVSGSMTVTGTNNLINISGSGFVVGQFPLIKYASGSLVSAGGLKLGSLPPGVNAALVNNTANQSVDLNITLIGQNLSWYGTNALWNINTTYNWNNAGAKYLEYGTSPNTYGDLVTFDDSLYNDLVNPQATNVNLTTTVRPSQITVSSSLPYSFTGAGSIAGGGALYQNGFGSLTLGTANAYTGGTFVNAGTLVVPNDSALGASSSLLTLGGGTLLMTGDSGSARLTTITGSSIVDTLPGVTGQLQLNGAPGGGNLTKANSGTLLLSSAGASGIGDFTVTQGLVRITSGAVNALATQGNSKIDGGASLEVAAGGGLSVSNGANAWFPLGDTAGTTNTLTINGGTVTIRNNWGIEAPRNGNAILTINSGSMTVSDIGGVGLIMGDQGTSESGTIHLNGGSLTVNLLRAFNGTNKFYFNGGTLRPAVAGTFFPSSGPLSTEVRNNGAVVDTAGLNATIAEPLDHSAVPGDNATDGGLTKTGSGTLVLSGANAYTGNTTVNAGTLELAQSVATLATNSLLTIAGGAQLRLDNAVVTNVVRALVLNGVTNAPGLYSSANGSGYITGAGYLLVLTGPAGPTSRATITNSFSGGVLSLSWPAGQGWRLQGQTNSLSTGLSNNWGYLTDGSVSSTNITVDATKPAVFYRLTYP